MKLKKNDAINTAAVSLALANDIHHKYSYLPASVVYTVAGLAVYSDEFTSTLTSQLFDTVKINKPAGFDRWLNANLSNLYGAITEEDNEDI